ncbi:MAG: polysaccharide deacetylase family protein [Planctomycetota bacterium]
MSTTRTPASVSVDLDNKWAYLKAAGNSDWESYPSFLSIAVPRMLDFLEQRELKITFFIVGRDAEQRENAEPLWSIVDSGHEIANHSYSHEPWMQSYTKEQLVEEFEKSEAAIFEATGAVPTGFRGPGFSRSDEILDQLITRGYRYDASTFPTFLGPVARAVFFLKTRLNAGMREKQKGLFGKLSDGFQSNKPYLIRRSNGRSIVEIPVTTMPFLKAPIHASYLMFLGRYSPALAMAYFRTAIAKCRLTGVEPSFLLHPTDFLGKEDDTDLEFFPGMDQPAQRKIDLLSSAFGLLSKRFDIVTMAEHASRYEENREQLREQDTKVTFDGARPREVVKTGD